MIYFVQGAQTGNIKIGYAKNDVIKSIRQLNCGSSEHLKIIGIIEGTRKTERLLHERFDQERLNGEWFRPSAEILLVGMKHEPFRYGKILRQVNPRES